MKLLDASSSLGSDIECIPLNPKTVFIFELEKILLTSECGFGHVPIEITRAKLKKLVEAAKILRKKY